MPLKGENKGDRQGGKTIETSKVRKRETTTR